MDGVPESEMTAAVGSDDLGLVRVRAGRIHKCASSSVTYHTACRRAAAVQCRRLAPLGLSSLSLFIVMGMASFSAFLVKRVIFWNLQTFILRVHLNPSNADKDTTKHSLNMYKECPPLS